MVREVEDKELQKIALSELLASLKEFISKLQVEELEELDWRTDLAGNFLYLRMKTKRLVSVEK